MAGSNKKSTERERGILTPKDSDWLSGESTNPVDQKRRCREGLQLAMEDIKELVETDPETVDNLSGIGELFADVEENTQLDRAECAESLIALAFIISNDSIDYSELAEEVDWHPRSTSEGASEADRTTSVRPPSYDVSEMLGFRNALSNGIKRGKEYIHRSENLEFNHPLIKSNTKLYKEPTEANVNPSENRLDFEVVRDIYAGLLDSTIPTGIITEDLQLPPEDEGHELTLDEAKDMNRLQNILNDVTPRNSMEIDGRSTAAEYIAKDIEMMVNRKVVQRHEYLADESDFGYELPENVGGELPGRIIPPSLGRRSTDSRKD